MTHLNRTIRATAFVAMCAVASWSLAAEARAVAASSDCWVATGNASATFCGFEMQGCDEIRVCPVGDACMSWSTSPLECGGVGVCCTEPE